MKPIIRYALLSSAVIVAGAGVTMAVIDRSPAPAANIASASSANTAPSVVSGRGRSGGGRFFAQFDLDHDGKVTRDEFNKTLAQDFAQSAGSAATMTQAQYMAYRMKDLRQRADQMFHRDDWNGDGKLSIEEYAAPERVRYEYADEDGAGTLACSGRSYASAPRTTSISYGGRGDSFGGAGRGGSGRSAICKYDDLNHDGKVTRTEFDQATAQEFASVGKNGSLSAEQFYAIIAGHVRDSATRMFARLDSNHDGKLDRDEFAASELRYFARMDRDGNGVVTREETLSQRRGNANPDSKPGRT